ncbi:MAG: thrombospondin type 3 repeat-containing protein [Myxococcales bacterium]|nr:thrombospondin type 3 repeat-containing protein [Myxococcales bacterium]
MRRFPFIATILALLAALTVSACTSDRGPIIAETTVLQSTSNEIGPYEVGARVYADNGVSTVTLHYSINGGETQDQLMSWLGEASFESQIPGQPIGSEIRYWVTATDHENNAAADPADAPSSAFYFRVIDRHYTSDVTVDTFVDSDASDGSVDLADADASDLGLDGNLDGSDATDILDEPDGPPALCRFLPTFPVQGTPVTAEDDIFSGRPGVQVQVVGDILGTPSSGADLSLQVNADGFYENDGFNNEYRFGPVDLADGQNILIYTAVLPDGGGCDLVEQIFVSSVANDRDGDGIEDNLDNCPDQFNPDQRDNEGDGIGNVCDSDDDNDNVQDALDNCPLTFNPLQEDLNGDGIGDACDVDRDGDGIRDFADNCPSAPNTDQRNTDRDQFGDVCDPDDDNDTILDTVDNCRLIVNPSQLDNDNDGAGDACDSDDDNDGILDTQDNCPFDANPSQSDLDNDGIGDLCDEPLECVEDDDCPDESICEDFECLAPMSCAISGDCPVGFVCRGSECVRVTDVPPPGFCGSDTDCDEGFVCTFNTCTPERCFDNGDCPIGQQCLSGECVIDIIPIPDRCESADECDEGENCVLNFCVPSQCESNGDCGNGESCILGFCAPIDLPIDIDQCSDDDDCPNAAFGRCYLGVCVPPIPFLPDECVDDRDCPEGQACTIAICLDAQCQVNADCPENQECIFGFCSPEDLPLPIPGSCSVDNDCPDGSSCLFSICIPDNAPIPRPCQTQSECPPALSCTFGFCLPLGF